MYYLYYLVRYYHLRVIKKRKWWKAIESDKKSLLQYQPRILRIGAHTLFSSLSWWGWGFGRECRSQRQTVHRSTEYWLYGGSNVVNFKEVASRVSNKNSMSFLVLVLLTRENRRIEVFLNIYIPFYLQKSNFSELYSTLNTSTILIDIVNHT